MRRSRRRNRKTGSKKKALLLFLAGVVVGLTAFIFYKIYTPTVPLKVYLGLYKVEKKPKEAVTPPALPKIAIVLDDFGYNYKNVEAVFNLKRPVTFSILPHHTYSKAISRRAYQKGYEEILHLPLEPYENDKYVRPELRTITINMKTEEILDNLTKALEEVPNAKGVSNHQGSKATENSVLMKVLFAELKKRNLFFLDSLVTSRSVGKKAAKDIGIGFGRRDIFLDNKEDFEYIKLQMQQLIKKAKRSGSAIGIGHDREKTVLALSKLMPEAEKEDVQFVFLSELIK